MDIVNKIVNTFGLEPIFSTVTILGVCIFETITNIR